MNYSANSCESSENENRDTPQQQIIEMGSTVVKNKRGTIHCLTIIGQVEGHTTLPPNVKTTKYEHVLPLLTSVEEKDDVDGLLLLLNTVGGDIEAGLGIAELVAGMTKPTTDQIEYIELGGADMAEICRPESTGPLAQAWNWVKNGVDAVVEYFR